MTSFECQFILSDRQRVRLRETVRIERCTELQAFHFPVNDRVFSPVDERIVCRLVTRDTELGVDVVLELKIVPVEVIRRDVQQDGYIRLEIVHIIQLEGTQFNHVIVVLLMCHLEGERVAYIARQTDVKTGIAQDIIDERSGRGLAV